MSKYEADVYFDGYLWCACVGGDFYGRFSTREAAYQKCDEVRCILAEITR